MSFPVKFGFYFDLSALILQLLRSIVAYEVKFKEIPAYFEVLAEILHLLHIIFAHMIKFLRKFQLTLAF